MKSIILQTVRRIPSEKNFLLTVNKYFDVLHVFDEVFGLDRDPHPVRPTQS